MANPPLASVIEISTSLPVPNVSQPSLPRPDGTIGLRISSEFTTHIAPVALVDGEHKLSLVRDATGHPLLFSVSSDEVGIFPSITLFSPTLTPSSKRLLCFSHQDGAAEAWQAFDITPSAIAGKVATFDVTETSQHLVLAVAIRAVNRTHVFTSVCTKASFDPNSTLLLFCKEHRMAQLTVR